MNKHKNRIAAAFLSCAMAVTNICSAATAYGAGKPAAEWQQSATYKGSNLNAQNYSKWSKPVRSYLVSCGSDSLMRIQYAESMDGILAEYYDKSYKFKSSKIIPKEWIVNTFSDNFFKVILPVLYRGLISQRGMYPVMVIPVHIIP